MQERKLRLGDILDDYCPRERRVTDHAVVAMVGEDVKQTRCTTCDAEHDYKKAKVPTPRKKKPKALYDQVLEDVTGDPAAAPASNGASPRLAAPGSSLSADGPAPAAAEEAEAETEAASPGADHAPDADGTAIAAPAEDGPVHRRLIRATLPRTEATAPVRQMPEFTIRQTADRPGKPGGGRHRASGGGAGQGRPGPRGASRSGKPNGRHVNGNRQSSPPSRGTTSRPGTRARSGKKRSR